MIKLANSRITDPAQLDDAFVLPQVVWAAIEKIGAKQKKPKMLVEGSHHVVQMNLSGEVDEMPFDQDVSSIVIVGHQQKRTSSVNPQIAELIALILGKLNSATRNKILNDLPAEFQENDNRLPVANAALVEEVKQMLRKLRETKTVTVNPAVRCVHSL